MEMLWDESTDCEVVRMFGCQVGTVLEPFPLAIFQFKSRPLFCSPN
jgi:hypothetical protein